MESDDKWTQREFHSRECIIISQFHKHRLALLCSCCFACDISFGVSHNPQLQFTSCTLFSFRVKLQTYNLKQNAAEKWFRRRFGFIEQCSAIFFVFSNCWKERLSRRTMESKRICNEMMSKQHEL